MIEILWVAGIFSLLLAVIWTTSSVSPFFLGIVGAGLLVLGLLVGGIPGTVYHLRLRARLVAHGKLAWDWWLRPTRFHTLLPDEEWAAIRPWFTAGAVGFTVAIVGCLLVLIAILQVSM